MKNEILISLIGMCLYLSLVYLYFLLWRVLNIYRINIVITSFFVCILLALGIDDKTTINKQETLIEKQNNLILSEREALLRSDSLIKTYQYYTNELEKSIKRRKK